MLPARLSSLLLPACLGLSVLGSTQVGQAQTAPQERARVPYAVVVADGGGLDAGTLRTLRSLVMGELRRMQQPVDEDPALEAPHAPAGVAALATRGNRVLTLRVAGRLGAKVPLFLEEVGKDGLVVGSATLTAAQLEECDIVIPRLVQALLGRKPVEETARMATVTEQESREFRNRPGNSHFIMGLQAPLFSGGTADKDTSGFSLGYLYNTEHWMLGVEGGGCTSGEASIGYPVLIHASWLPSDGPISPYFGAGIGYLSVREKGMTMSGGLGFRLSAGVEFFRLHRMRLQAGLDLYLPNGGSEEKSTWSWNPATGQSSVQRETVSAKSVYPVLHVRVAF